MISLPMEEAWSRRIQLPRYLIGMHKSIESLAQKIQKKKSTLTKSPYKSKTNPGMMLLAQTIVELYRTNE